MSRIAVCLFFIAIFQYGIIKSSADETTTEDVSKNTEETTMKPTEDEPAKEPEVPAKVEAEDKSGTVKSTSDVPQKKDDIIPNKGKAAEPKDSKKEDATEKTDGSDNRKFLPDMLKGNSNDQTKGLFDFPNNILEPVSAVGAKLSEAVSKSIDTAKKVAGGTFNLLRTSVNGAFEY